MPRIDITAREVAAASRPLWPLLAATAGTLVAAPVYGLLLDHPLIRSTAWPMFLLAGAGAVAGAAYARLDDRTWVRWLGVVNVAALLFAATWYFWLSSLPAADARARSLATAPDFKLSDQNGRQVSLSALIANGPVLLFFYRGSWCPFCVSELRGLAKIREDLRAAGVSVVGISVDTPSRAQQAAERLDLKIPLLSDAEATVIGEYGVVDRGGGPQGEDIAIPSHFLVGRDGQILWRRIADRVHDRPDPQDVLRAVREHAGAA